MDFEQALEETARQYREEGYEVFIRPDKDQLPDFALGFGVELLAIRGNEKALVRVVKNRAALEATPSVPEQAEATDQKPGWRYDLVVLEADDPFQRLTRGAREPSEAEIDEILTEAEALSDRGNHRAALLMGWAALEATLRQTARSAGLEQGRTVADGLLPALYGHGLLTSEEYTALRDSFRLRTEVVHGLIGPAVEVEAVRGVTAMARKLLSGAPD